MNGQVKLSDKSVRLIGFWAAGLTTLWTVWFIGAFAAYLPSLPSEWPGIEAFAASFKALPYLAWVVPCLLLALTFPVLISSIHYSVVSGKKIWSLLGLVFAVMYGAILSTNYWVLATVVRESLIEGHAEGLSWFVIGSPYSITNTIEGIGYGFMGLAMVFASQAFTGGRLEGWIRWLFIVNGMAGIAGVALSAFGISAVAWISLVVWSVTFPVATALVAVLFKRIARG